MDIEELKQFIEASEFTPETKQKVWIVLAGKAVLDYDTYAGVKEILQQELDKDFKEAGVDLDGDLEAEKIQKEYETSLAEIDASVEEDNMFIKAQTESLDGMADKLNAISEKDEVVPEAV